MIGTVCIAAAVLGLCARVRRSLERNRLFRRDLAGGRVRIAPRYNQGAGFGALPLSARQMAPLSLAALWALLCRWGFRGVGSGPGRRRTQQSVGAPAPRPGAGLSACSKGPRHAETIHIQPG